MLERIIDASLRYRWLVLLATAAMAALGASNFLRLPIDAVPDITNVQVQINTEAPGYSPLEAERRITFLIENAMSGLPRLDYTRSLSRYGLSQVTVVFEDGTDIYFARNRVAARLQEVKSQLPPGSESAMGPIATGLGEIFMFIARAEPGALKPDGTAYDATDLHTLLDWVVSPQLARVPGVTEISTVGGHEREYLGSKDFDKTMTFFADVPGLEMEEMKKPEMAEAGLRVGLSFKDHVELISFTKPPTDQTPPHIARIGKGARNSGSFPGGTTRIALGHRSVSTESLPRFVAIFATSLLVAPPSEHGRRISSRIIVWMFFAIVSESSGISLTSINASSTEICSTYGVRLSSFSITLRDRRPYPPPWGTTISPGHILSARAIGIADRTPNLRAAYEQEETTPRPSGLPPTANGFPSRLGSRSTSTAQKKASRSRCRILRAVGTDPTPLNSAWNLATRNDWW